MSGPVVLEVEGVVAGYGELDVLHDVSLSVGAGEIVALIGSNGAGKTTALRTVAGLLPVRAGRVRLGGEVVSGRPAHEIVPLGLALVPEGRRLWPELTVRENLLLGGFTRGRGERAQSLARVLELFPRLRERSSQKAGTLSGGEQQMAAIARGLMSRPRVLLLDEPSLGLAPVMVQDVFRIVESIREEGVSVLLVEQHLHRALEIADRGYLLETGRIRDSGPSRALLDDARIREAYLGS